jgi:hypothetical protein
MNNEREWLTGPLGGEYYVNERGERIYKREIRNQKIKPSRSYKPKRGAFYRHLQNQVDSSGQNLDLC